jgi:hypothetical protein
MINVHQQSSGKVLLLSVWWLTNEMSDVNCVLTGQNVQQEKKNCVAIQLP